MSSFFSSAEYVKYNEAVDQFIKKHLSFRAEDVGVYSPQLLEAMEYSLFNGGKRFRPVLSLFTSRGLTGEVEKVLPWAIALEMVHTYSLIHDDLPCMDNDDFRRGQPTSHKKYGEALALLAGDALLTESFFVLASHYATHPHLGELVQLLSSAAGASGMVGGQAMDMGFGLPMTEIAHTQRMHGGKTGALISAAVQGAGLVSAVSPEHKKNLKELGDLMGLAFQIKDDLLDMENDPRSYIYFLGAEGTEKTLSEVHAKAREILSRLPQACSVLAEFISANAERNK